MLTTSMTKMMTTTKMDRCRAERCFRPWPEGPSVARERGARERDALGRPSSPQLRRSRGCSPEALALLRLRRPPLRPWRGLRNHLRSGPHGKAWTLEAQPYPRALVTIWSRLVDTQVRPLVEQADNADCCLQPSAHAKLVHNRPRHPIKVTSQVFEVGSRILQH